MPPLPSQGIESAIHLSDPFGIERNGGSFVPYSTFNSQSCDIIDLAAAYTLSFRVHQPSAVKNAVHDDLLGVNGFGNEARNLSANRSSTFAHFTVHGQNEIV